MENLHHRVIGKSGFGKSTFLESHFLQNLKPDRAAIFIDPHGTSIESILHQLPRRYANRTCVIDLGSGWVVGFNPVTEPQHLITTFESQWRELQARALNRLYFSLAALYETKRTLLDLPRIFTSQDRRSEILSRVRDPATLEFWEEEYAAAPDRFNAEANEAVLNKINRFLAYPHIRQAVAVGNPVFDYAKILKHHYIVLIDLNKPTAGATTANLYGGFHVNALYAQIMKTPHPCDLYIDEFPSLGSDIFASILSESRKYGLTLTISHQYLSQIKDDNVRDAIAANTPITTAFALSPTDAKDIGALFDTDLQTFAKALRSLSKFEAWQHTPQGNHIIRVAPPAPMRSHAECILAESNARFAKVILAPDALPSNPRYRSRSAPPGP